MINATRVPFGSESFRERGCLLGDDMKAFSRDVDRLVTANKASLAKSLQRTPSP